MTNDMQHGNDRNTGVDGINPPAIDPHLRRTCAAMDPTCAAERSATRDYIDAILNDLRGRQRRMVKLRDEVKRLAAANRKLKQERKGFGKVDAARHDAEQRARRYAARIDADARIIVDLTRENDALRRAK